MSYNLRSKRQRLDINIEEPDGASTDVISTAASPTSTSSAPSTHTSTNGDESRDESRDESFTNDTDSNIEDEEESMQEKLFNKLFGEQEQDNLCSSNLYHLSHYEKMDRHFIDILHKDLPLEVRLTYKEKMVALRKVQIEGYVTIEDILNAEIPEDKKAELMVLYDQLKQFQYYQDEFIFVNRKIKKTIEYYNNTNSVFMDDEKELMHKIKTAAISEFNRDKLMKKLFSLQKCDTNEKHDILSYIEYGLKIVNEPNAHTEFNSNYSNLALTIKADLDNILFGQDKAKEEIIDNVICRSVNPGIGNISVFLGAPGVGKTHTARNLANILGYKFYQISLGSISDAHSITGSLSTYVGSRPGEIYNAIADMGCNNGIIFLDEFDKIFDTAKNTTNSSLENVFLNILDPAQNCNYKDNHLFDLNMDLSKIWFIVSVNNLDHIHGPIKDRLRPIITFDNYTTENKISIVKKFIIPDTMKRYNIAPSSIHIEEEVYKLVCTSNGNNTADTGIREVKNICELLLKRFNTLILAGNYKPSYFIKLLYTENNKPIINADVVKRLTEPVQDRSGKFLSFYS